MAAVTPTTSISNHPVEPIVIYAFEGSHYVFKVLAALQSRNIKHYVTFVDEDDVEKRRKQLPSGGLSVPEMTVGTGNDQIIVSDSEKILHWLDDNYLQTNFLFPSEEVSPISQRASDETLPAMVSYYNNVDKKGYKRSYQREIREEEFPRLFPKILANKIIDHYMKDEIKRARETIKRVIPAVDDELMKNEPAMRRILIDELKYFQDFLKYPSQKYLLEDSDQPTAADFSVYAQIVRLVAGGTSDSEIYAALPELCQEKSLERLWQWYDNMKDIIQVEYLGKQPPKEMLKA